MELLEFDLARAERELTLQNYERVKPVSERLLGRGYTPVRVAALMFQYGYLFGRKLLRDCQKEDRKKYLEARAQTEDQGDKGQTSGENEGSI